MFDLNDDARAGYRRVEVRTGPGRCRRWSAESKAQVGVTVPPSPSFVPIYAEPPLPPAAPVAAPVPAPTSPPVIEVEVADAVVRVLPGMDAALLTSVLRAVRASAGGA